MIGFLSGIAEQFKLFGVVSLNGYSIINIYYFYLKYLIRLIYVSLRSTIVLIINLIVILHKNATARSNLNFKGV